jgi:hypothetical protein
MACKAQLPVCCSFQNPKHACRKVVIAHVRHNITPDQRSGQQGALFQEPVAGMSGSGVEHGLRRGLLVMHDRRTDPRREEGKVQGDTSRLFFSVLGIQRGRRTTRTTPRGMLYLHPSFLVTLSIISSMHKASNNL